MARPTSGLKAVPAYKMYDKVKSHLEWQETWSIKWVFKHMSEVHGSEW